MEEDFEKCLVGYLDQEMGHVAFSDFGVAERFAKKYPGCEGLPDVIEDALIETACHKKRPTGTSAATIQRCHIEGRKLLL